MAALWRTTFSHVVGLTQILYALPYCVSLM
jgi:hypothetical protein